MEFHDLPEPPRDAEIYHDYRIALDKAHRHVRAMERARSKVTDLDMAIGHQQRTSLKGRNNMTEVIIRQHIAKAKEVNTERKDLIADCQWQMQQANMYSLLATAIMAGM